MWKGSGRSLFQTLVLENFKFTLFVLTPIATATIFSSDSAVEFLVGWTQYITYPAEARRPPDNTEELREQIAKMAQNRAAAPPKPSA